LEKSGKFDEAREMFKEALAASPAPGDQLLARQRLAYLALQQTRYEEAVTRFGEVIASFEQTGNRLNKQFYLVERARAYAMLGDFAASAADLERVRAEKPASEKVQWQYDLTLAGLDFQQLRFDASIARLEAMRAKAAKAGSKLEAVSMNYQLCSKYAEAGKFAQAAVTCEPLKKEFANRPAQLIPVYYAMAEVYMARKQHEKAVSDARQAVIYSQQTHDLRNTWYSTLILTECLHGARNSEWKQTRIRAAEVLAEITREGGEAATKSYLARPMVARRKNAIDALQ
jgi:tetratricopeptide (TPR) repeat protein